MIDLLFTFAVFAVLIVQFLMVFMYLEHGTSHGTSHINKRYHKGLIPIDYGKPHHRIFEVRKRKYLKKMGMN